MSVYVHPLFVSGHKVPGKPVKTSLYNKNKLWHVIGKTQQNR